MSAEMQFKSGESSSSLVHVGLSLVHVSLSQVHVGFKSGSSRFMSVHVSALGTASG